MRVNEYAKELGISSKELLELLHAAGVEVKSHSSNVEAEAIERVKKSLAAPAAQAAEKPAAKPAHVAPPPPAASAKAAAPAPQPAAATAPIPAAPIPAAPAPAAPAPKPAAPTAAPAPTAAKSAPAKPFPAPGPAPRPAAPVPQQKPPTAVPRTPPPAASAPPPAGTIRIKGPVVVKELAEQLHMPPNKLIAELMGLKIMASITERLDIEVARKIAEKHGFVIEMEKRSGDKPTYVRKPTEDEEQEDRPEDLQPRPPVVTFMGHVDHGKTSLMDRIRRTQVAKGEYGGITQHIGAYTVDVQGRSITFLDTPGHAAFTAMRARGANLTDIAVIVVAADDGIMPQTREAIQHARAAEVQIMIAINKIDLPAANLEKVKGQLQAENLSPEEWGGEIICCPVSAVTGDGIDHLLEMILLQADVLDLKANPRRRAQGFVVEAQMQPGMGPTANLLVTAGTLNVGDLVLCGPHCGKVRALINDHGVKVKSAGPSTPVMCLGLPGVPDAGAEFKVFANEKAARTLAQESLDTQKKESLMAGPRKASLETLFGQIESGKKLELKVVLKADTQGSIEAIQHALGEIKSEKVSLHVILASTGNVTVNDIMLASASNAIILGFHVGREPGVDSAARREGVETRIHHIIYELIDEVKSGMTGLLAPICKEKVVGRAEIRKVFPIGKTSNVAGCMVIQGHIMPKLRARLRRGKEVLFEGSLLSLKHFQDSVSEVRESQECGIRLDGFNAFNEGDLLEFFEIEQIQQTL